MQSIGAIVLASGSSSRFEGENKLLVPYQGKPILQHVLDALPSALFARRLVVTRSEEIVRLAEAAGFEALRHHLPDVSDTIRLGTAAMAEMDGCLYAVGDQPLLTAETVKRLTALFQAHPERIVRVGKDGRVGNPVIFPSFCFDGLRTLPLGEGGNAIMHRRPELVLVAEAVSALELYDVDTRRDYESLSKE